MKWNGARFDVLFTPRDQTVSAGRPHVAVDLAEEHRIRRADGAVGDRCDEMPV